MEDGYIALLIAMVFLISSILGFALGKFETDKMIEVCKKNNNVYVCEIIARPVK